MSLRDREWVFVRFCVAVLTLMGVLGVGMATAAWQGSGPPATTAVSDTVYRGDGTPAGGTVLISWPAFTTMGGASVPAGNTAVVLGSAGQLQVSLVPNAGSNPMGSYYTVVYHLNDGSTTREYWVIPASGGTVSLQAIKSTVLPASVAMQTVSKAYVDTAIAAASAGAPLGGTTPYVPVGGGAMTGPLVLPADPVSAQQAADKHYVDTQVATVGGGSAGKLSTLPQTTQTGSAAGGDDAGGVESERGGVGGPICEWGGKQRDCQCSGDPGLCGWMYGDGRADVSRYRCGECERVCRWNACGGQAEWGAVRYVSRSAECDGVGGEWGTRDRCGFDARFGGAAPIEWGGSAVFGWFGD